MYKKNGDKRDKAGIITPLTSLSSVKGTGVSFFLSFHYKIYRYVIMPYEIRQLSPRKFEVINPISGEIHAKHTSLKKAKAQVRLLLSVMKNEGKRRKRGGMLGWVSSVLGRHPKLTAQQIRDAERFADELMADPTGVSFEGAITIPSAVRKELAEEAYNRKMMGKEDRPAVGDASDIFADEIRKQLEAQKKKKGRGRRSGGKFGFTDFVNGLNKLNPVMWGIQNHPDVGIKLGEVTNNNLLPAVVAVGKPVYDATAIALATTYTGNPVLGKVVADEFWNQYGRPYDPRNRQDNEALKIISEKVGKEAGKKAEQIAEGAGYSSSDSDSDDDSLVYPVNYRSKGLDWYGGASTLQKGEACEARGYLNPASGIYRELNQIIHSGDPPIGKYGLAPNPFRDLTNSYDPITERKLQYAYKKITGQTPTQTAKKASPPAPKKTGKGYITPALGKPLHFF